jgi:hypothetical protein
MPIDKAEALMVIGYHFADEHYNFYEIAERAHCNLYPIDRAANSNFILARIDSNS